jgi:hypothetical protein
MFRRVFIGFLAVLSCVNVSMGALATFDDLALDVESYWNGSDETGGFYSGAAFFKNNYNTEWLSWDGFSYSNRTDTSIAGLDGQYTAMAGSGQGGSKNYAVSFVGWSEAPMISFGGPTLVEGLYVTNSAYTYYSMSAGDAYAKKFGGKTGDDQDWLKLIITGKDYADQATGTVEFYLADYRFADNQLDYIVSNWEYVDLSSLGNVSILEFALSSSDVGDFGMNTPAYFAIDTVVPEPATLALLIFGSSICLNSKRKK